MFKKRQSSPSVREYVSALVKSDRLGPQVAFHTILPGAAARWSSLKSGWSSEIANALAALGIRKLYQHQVEAIEYIRKRQHVIVATPTASGKTLVYNLPTLEKIQRNSQSKSLFRVCLSQFDQLLAKAES